MGSLAPQTHKQGRSLQQSRGVQTPSTAFPPQKLNKGSPEKDLLHPQAGKRGNPAANISKLGLIQLSQAKSISQRWAHLLSWAPAHPALLLALGEEAVLPVTVLVPSQRGLGQVCSATDRHAGMPSAFAAAPRDKRHFQLSCSLGFPRWAGKRATSFTQDLAQG